MNSTRTPIPRCRSRRGSPRTRSSFRRRSRRSRKSTRPASTTSASGPRSGRAWRGATSSAPARGMAAALFALNQVFGDCYEVERRGGRRPEGVRGEMAEGSVHLRRADPPRGCRKEVVRRHTTRRGHGAVLPDAPPAGGLAGEEPGAAQPRPLRQGSLRRQRHGDGDHQRRAHPRVGQEPAAARPDGRHAEVRQRSGRLAARAVARPACGPTSARKSSRRWSGRSRN